MSIVETCLGVGFFNIQHTVNFSRNSVYDSACWGQYFTVISTKMTPVCVGCIKFGLKKWTVNHIITEKWDSLYGGEGLVRPPEMQSLWMLWVFPSLFPFLQDHLALQRMFFTDIFARLKLGAFIGKDSLKFIHTVVAAHLLFVFDRGMEDKVLKYWRAEC